MVRVQASSSVDRGEIFYIPLWIKPLVVLFVAILIFKTGKQLDDKDKFITGISIPVLGRGRKTWMEKYS